MLIHGDCLEVMRGMDANSVDAVITDPPYYKVKGEDWDNQWDTPAKFLAWVGLLCEQFERILKPNGSLYFFASPQMAARVDEIKAAGNGQVPLVAAAAFAMLAEQLMMTPNAVIQGPPAGGPAGMESSTT